MIDRRRFMVAAAAPAAASFASPVLAQATECAVFTPARQSAISPDQALQRLVEGNARFVAGRTINCDLRLQVKETAQGQAPFAAIVGCIDSRVPPEFVFDQRWVTCSARASPATSSTTTSSAASSSRLGSPARG